jgi:hypothetical protein
MNAGVALARTYFQANGFFSVVELPIVRRGKGGHFHELTDVDLLGIRFPHARYLISMGEPGVHDDLVLETDSALGLDPDLVEVAIVEVKTGKPKINPGMMADETLSAALMRTGILPPERIAKTVDALKVSGEARIAAEGGVPATRVRVMAVGQGKPGERARYTVLSLKQMARFLKAQVRRYRDILNPIEPSDETLALLQLMDRLE